MLYSNFFLLQISYLPISECIVLNYYDLLLKASVRPNVLTKDFELKGLFKHLALLTSIIVSWCAKIEKFILFGILGRGIKCTM